MDNDTSLPTEESHCPQDDGDDDDDDDNTGGGGNQSGSGSLGSLFGSLGS